MAKAFSRLQILPLCLMVGCTTAAQLDRSPYPVIDITPQLVYALHPEPPDAPSMPAPTKEVPYGYKIGPGDVLSFRLMEGYEPVATNGYVPTDTPQRVQVEENGQATFPYAGTLSLKNQTADQVRARLGKALGRYFKAPRFELQLVEFHSRTITVSGAVTKPGIQTLGYAPTSISKALEAAGGAQPNADLTATIVIHPDQRREIIDADALLNHGDITQDKILQPGDTLLLSETHRNRVFLMGEALKPGALFIKGGHLSLTEAVNESQGPSNEAQGPNNVSATTNYIYVIRNAVNETHDTQEPYAATDTNHILIYRLDTTIPTAFVVADQFMLKPRDVIYIAAAPVTEWHRFITQLLPGNLTTNKSID